jgi:hypothetical protein
VEVYAGESGEVDSVSAVSFSFILPFVKKERRWSSWGWSDLREDGVVGVRSLIVSSAIFTIVVTAVS